MKYVGRIIQNFYCNGFFGRNFYLNGSEIIAEGEDWIAIRTPVNEVISTQFLEGWQLHDMEKMIDEWTNESSG